MLRNTTAVVIITLGFMTFGVWQEQNSGKAVCGGGGGGGSENFGDSQSNERAQMGSVRPHFVYQMAVPSIKRELFVMHIFKVTLGL